MKKFALFTAALLAFALVAGCSTQKTQEKNLLEDYVVVYAEGDASAEDAASEIAAAAKEETGVELAVKGDSSGLSSKEILIGNVQGRSYSYYTSRLHKTGGWDVRVLEGNIYITSDTGDYGDAVSAFTQFFIRSEFSDNTSVSSSGSYRIGRAELGGLPLGCYDIVYPAEDAAAESAAGELSSWIAENVGYVMPVCGEGQEENLLNLCLSPQENRQDAETCTLSLGSGGALIEYAAGETEHAVQSFIAHFFRSEETDVVLPEEGTFGFMVWEYLDSDYETDEIVISPTQIAGGVSWSNFTMTDADGTPQSVFVLEAEAGGNWELRVGTHPDYRKGSPVVSTVPDTAEAYRAAGEDVLFACNGGYFKMSTDNTPEGVLIRDGEMLSAGLGALHHDFFGLKADGSFVIGEYDLLEEISSELVQACGGRGVILQDGQPYDISYTEGGDDIGVNVNPRTAVGFRENGDLLIVVADGRQSGYAAGMNLVDLAQVFKSLGAISALNLDGGGSSTFVTKNADGGLSVKNKTSNSGGALRAVGDCLILIAA